MLLLDNLRQRLREWQEQDDEPDLVPRLRRLWRRQEADGPPVRVQVARPTVGLRPARVWHLRRAS